MRILFCAIPAYGHVFPLMPLAQACAGRGHDVELATGSPFVGRLPLPTVEAMPAHATLTWCEEEAFRRHPELGIKPPDQRWQIGLELFADVACELLRDGLVPELEADPPDLVIYEAMAVGAATAAHAFGIPSACFAIGQWSFFPAALHRATLDRQVPFWQQFGVDAPSPRPVLGEAYLDPIPPSLQSGDTTVMPTRIALRSVAWSGDDGVVPSWLHEPRVRPRLYVTLGTVSHGAVEVLRATLEAASSLDVEVLVTVGPEGDPAVLGPQPEHVHVERYVAQNRVLPLVDAVVHHGGMGTLLAALAEGIPQVLIPQGADQFMNAGTFARIGAGRAIMPPDLGSGALRESLEAMFLETSIRSAAAALKLEIEQMPSPSDVVGSVEELV